MTDRNAQDLPPRSRCPCCGAGAWRARWEQFVVCRRCGFMTVRRRPDDDELRPLYGGGYFRGGEYADYLADKPVQQRMLADRLSLVRRYVPAGGRLLEIGCAHGFFLELASRYYPHLLGVDISADAVAHARRAGLNAVAGDPLEVELPGRFDAACLWDTLEHLPRPVEVVARAARHLRPGGWLFATTGDLSSALPRLRGRRWRQIHPPTHLHYFTRRALREMCESAGLELTGFCTVSIRRRLGSALETLRHLSGASVAGRVAAAVERILPSRLLDVSFPLDLGDTVCVIARAAV